MPFSFCIITKNEKSNIEKCINALLPYGQEIVVADTGSTDGTVEYLGSLAKSNELIKYLEFEWIDDFAAAKNYVIHNASNEYVFVVDSDEFVIDIDMCQLEKLIDTNPKAVGRVNRCNVITNAGTKQENLEWINRIFSKALYRYEGSIHEQLVAINGSEYDCYRAPVRMIHTGYDLCKEQLEVKAYRNIDMLNRELTKLLQDINCNNISELEGIKPETNSIMGQIPYILYQLGKSFYMMGDYDKAVSYFAEGLIFDLNPKLEYVIDMVETYGYALINSGRAKEALFFEGIYDEFASADFHFLMGLIYMNNAMFDNAINEFLKATEYTEVRIVGVNSFSAYYNIGVIYECLGNSNEAEHWYIKSGDYEPALAGLTRIRK